MTYRNAIIKRRLEYLGMLPFVLLGRLYGILFPLRSKSSAFLFFPSADIGGAIKVNADITECILDKHPVIIFSKVPKNNGHRQLFNLPGVTIIDLSSKIDNKLFHFVNFFYRGVLATWINRADNPVVFGGESLFFYKILAHVRKDVRRVELCHLDTWLHYSIGFIDLIDHRVFSTKKLMEIVQDQYKANHLPDRYARVLSFIENKIDIPPYEEVHNDILQVVFVGRGAPQKRVYLIANIAQKAHELQLPIHFSFVGDVENVFDISAYPYCTFYGNVRDEAKMNSIYKQSDVLILTSAYEGLPLVVMQMMAHAKVVLTTAVNALPDYIRHLENGLLITATDEQRIVEEGIEQLTLLLEQPSLKHTLGLRSREIAIQKFGGEVFRQQFREVLFKESAPLAS